MICTVAEVKDGIGARIDGTEYDDAIPRAIAAAQAMIEHECGVADGSFATAPNDATKQCAVALCVQLIDNPAATRDELGHILRSSMLDGSRTYV